jgi:alpha 1,2-mannosyltransferase
VIAVREIRETVPTIWATAKEFIKAHPDILPDKNALSWITDNNGDSFNLCHYWSNFQIGALSLFRSKAYGKYFDHMDKAGGIYYERWCAAPLLTIGVTLLTTPDQVHFFNDIGYKHTVFQHCPKGDEYVNKCFCNVDASMDNRPGSCVPNWKTVFDA